MTFARSNHSAQEGSEKRATAAEPLYRKEEAQMSHLNYYKTRTFAPHVFRDSHKGNAEKLRWLTTNL